MHQRCCFISHVNTRGDDYQLDKLSNRTFSTQNDWIELPIIERSENIVYFKICGILSSWIVWIEYILNLLFSTILHITHFMYWSNLVLHHFMMQLQMLEIISRHFVDDLLHFRHSSKTSLLLETFWLCHLLL